MTNNYRRIVSNAMIPAIVFFCVVSSGCVKTATFNLRNIEEPVMLNDLPYPGAQWQATEVGSYLAVAGHSSVDGTDFTGRNRSTDTVTDNAQLRAFESIGGHSRRVISIDKIRVGSGVAGLFGAVVDLTDVTVWGRVQELSGSDLTLPSKKEEEHP